LKQIKDGVPLTGIARLAQLITPSSVLGTDPSLKVDRPKVTQRQQQEPREKDLTVSTPWEFGMQTMFEAVNHPARIAEMNSIMNF
jgi:hypothetical protein